MASIMKHDWWLSLIAFYWGWSMHALVMKRVCLRCAVRKTCLALAKKSMNAKLPHWIKKTGFLLGGSAYTSCLLLELGESLGWKWLVNMLKEALLANLKGVTKNATTKT